MEEILGDSGFDSIGEFLQILFYNPTRGAGKEDPRGVAHGLAVARFFQGKTKIKMSLLLFTLTGTMHRLQDLPNPTSAMHLSRHLSLSPKSSTRLLLYSLGQQILSSIMFTERSMNLLVRTTMPTFKHRQMAVARIVSTL
jgi:hypothetical protein